MKKWLWMLLVCSNVYAYSDLKPLEQVIEVASKKPVYQSKTGKSVAVIDSSLIKQDKESRLVDSIHGVPGLEVKKIVGLDTIRIRGMRSYDTKYLYNGIPLKDTSHPQNSYSSLLDNTANLGNTEIQILKGSGSILYGSDAIGGVVDFIPKEDEWSVSSEVGKEYTETVTSPYGGISRIDDKKLDNTSFRLQHKWEHVEPWLTFINSTSPINNAPYVTGGDIVLDQNDENDRSEEKLWHGGAKITFEPWSWTIGDTNSNRRFVFLPNEDGSGFYSDGTYHGNALYSDVRFSHSLGTVGYTYTRDFYKLETVGERDEIDRYENDFYIEKPIDFERLNLLFGLRENVHEDAKHRTVWDISGVYHFDETLSLRSHVGTGFRAPSVYELAGAFLTDFGRFEIGNPDLSPEHSFSYDVGIEKQIACKVNLGLVYFHSRIANRIGFVEGSYANTPGYYQPHGIEAYYEQYLLDGLSVRLAYTQTLAENLIDIGRHSLETSLRYKRDSWSASVRTRLKDKHRIELFDYDTFQVDRMEEDGSFTIDATVSYAITGNIEAYVRADNLLSEDYTMGAYRQPGSRVYAGIKVNL